MAKEVAYTPISNIKNITSEAPQKIDTPDYPDQGVKFAGYAKKYIGQGNYKLIKQEFKNSGTRFGWTAANNELSLSINADSTKNFYITDIVIEGYSNTDCYFGVCDISNGNAIFRLMCLAGAGVRTQVIHLQTPLPFLTNTIFCQPLNLATGAGIAITGRCFIEWFGFTEDKT